MADDGFPDTGWIPQLGYGMAKGRKVNAEEYIVFVEGELRDAQSALQATIARASGLQASLGVANARLKTVEAERDVARKDAADAHHAYRLEHQAWLDALQAARELESQRAITEAALDEAKKALEALALAPIGMLMKQVRETADPDLAAQLGEKEQLRLVTLAHIAQTQGGQP